MRILIGPVEISGIAAGLNSGFSRLGIESEIVINASHPYCYANASPPPAPARIWSRLGDFSHRRQSRSKPVRILAWMPWRAWAVLVWLWALLRYDSFIFLFGKTITDSAIEARLYRLLGKRVVMVYCGTDARPPYVDGPTCNHYGPSAGRKLSRLARRIRNRVRLHERSGFVCVNSPFTAQFHTRPFVNWFAMGIPRELADDISSPLPPEADPEGTVRIIHSPSHPAAKGTDIIVGIVEKLKREGHPVELVLLQGVPNEEVQAELRRSDLAIDQCWSDQPMAGFVVEAAHHGKPAVVSGYAAADEYRHLFSANPPPTTFVHPDDLEAAVRSLVADPQRRRELGRRAFDFVRAHWTPANVAGRYLDLLQGRIDPALLVQPGNPIYVQGAGLSEKRGREAVRATVRENGPKALHLDHNAELEKAFLDWAAAEPTPP